MTNAHGDRNQVVAPQSRPKADGNLAERLRFMAERQRFQGPRPELEEAAAFVESFMAFYPNAAQLMDGFMANSPGEQWTEWDRGVRAALTTLGEKAGM